MRKKLFVSVAMAVTLVITTAFSALSVDAAQVKPQNGEKNVTLAEDKGKAQTEYVLKEREKSSKRNIKARNAKAQIASADALTYDWDEDTETLQITGQGKVIGNNDASEPLEEYRDQVKKIVLGEGITEIDKYAFMDFTNLQEITFSSTITKIDEAAFYRCYSLETVELPDSLTTICKAAFADCIAMETVKLSKKIRTIEDFAFQRCAMETITIPGSLKVLSPVAFFKCPGLQTYQVASDNAAYCTQDGVLFSTDKKTLLAYPSGRKSDVYTTPATTVTIGENAFNNTKITKIFISDSVKSIRDGAFAYSKLESLNIPNSVTDMGQFICESCESLCSVIVGKGLKKLPYRSFYKCSSLSTVKLSTSLRELEPLSFAYCASLKRITIPSNVTIIYNGCFGECSSLTEVSFSKKVKEIAYQAFFNCKNLKTVTFPKSLKKIHALSFYGTRIRTVKIPTSVTFIGKNAFPPSAALSGVSTLTRLEDGSYIKLEKLPIKVKYDYKTAFDVVKKVNRERKKRGLKTVSMDKRMLKGSMLRAAELAIAFSHTRPSGRDFNTACYDKKQGYIMMGENIASGQTTSASVMNSWMHSPGHKANILTRKYKGIGVGAVVVNGVRYWVQNFSITSVQKASASSYKKKMGKVNVEVVKNNSLFRVKSIPSIKLKKGASAQISYKVNNSFLYVPLNASEMKYKVAKPSICKVSASGKVKGLKVGKTKITVIPKNAPSFAKSLTVTVKSK